VTEVLPDYVFDRPFEKGENSIGVKYLQTLLKKLGFYTYTINSTFDANTAEAVYKFQIAKGILKGVAGETAQGFVGPSTRSALNGEMKNQAAIAPVAAPVPTTIPEVITTPEVTPTIATNPFLGLLNKMEAKYSSKDAFVALMYKARANVVLKAADETISVKQKMVLETIKEAVDLYLNENQ
jgi:peptidoglycan hydrolase-like protein with peptidoglycan-binding domain